MTDGVLTLPSDGAIVAAGDPYEAMRALIDAWCIGKSQHTRRARENDLRRFARFLGVEERAEAGAWALLDPPSSAANARAAMLAARDKARAFDAWNQAEGLTPQSRARMLTSLRSLVKEANIRGLPWVLTGVQNPKFDAYDAASGPPPERIEAAIAWEFEHGSSRDTAALLLLYDVGLRVSSVERLAVRDCDFENGRIRVWVKGDRIVHFRPSRRCLDALEQRVRELEHQPDAKIDGRTTGGIRAWCHRIGIGHPHGCRHTAGTLIAERTGDVRMVQSFLGHKNLTTSQIYIDRIRDDAGRASKIVAGEMDGRDDRETDTHGQGDRQDRNATRQGAARVQAPRTEGAESQTARGRGEADQRGSSS